VIALMGLIAGLLMSAPAAQATSTVICKGFTACAKMGLSSFGYGPTNYKKMWWRMYSGHNCTNYMSYRMIQAGMSSTRPWSGSGDARNWGVVFKSKTNQTPMVGSVAWWSSNHVAYVQQIIDANTIIISEDHYGGDFDWRKIVRSGGGWPTGFIHLEDEAVTATAPPAVTGTPQVDAKLTVKPGTWNKTGATYRYQWLAGGKAIAGATASSYVPTPDEVGDAFTVKVTATKAGYKTGTSTSKATSATIPGVMQISGTPTISGIAKVGATLSAALPTWSPIPDATTYGWFADGVYIPGGSSTSITLKPAQLGKSIRFVARATRDGYTDASSSSAPTTKVLPEKLAVSEEPALVGNPYVGRPFSVTPGAVTPAATTKYQWLRDGVAIPGAGNPTYTPTSADPGSRLSVLITYSRSGYTTITRELKPKQAVRSYARIYVRSLGKKSVTVTVLADGVPVVHGDVVVTGRTGLKKQITLVGGRATLTAAWLYSGVRPLTISYLGSFVVEARTQTKTVDIR
jgi:surface antigen